MADKARGPNETKRTQDERLTKIRHEVAKHRTWKLKETEYK